MDIRQLDLVNYDNFIHLNLIQLNSILKKNTIIGELNAQNKDSMDQEDDEDDEEDDDTQNYDLQIYETGKITYIIKKGEKIVNSKQVILKMRQIICGHCEVTQDGICIICNEKINSESQNNNKNLGENIINVKGISNDTKFNKKYAEVLTNQKLEILHESKKLMLVLDIDNTLLHAICTRNMKKKFDTTEHPDIFVLQYPNDNVSRFLIKERDFMEQFLELIFEHFDVYIFTKATKSYAIDVCGFFKWKYPDLCKKYQQVFFTNERIIAREDYDNDEHKIPKNLDLILPNCERYMLILDDRKDVWKQYRPNVVHTYPYYYWKDNSFWYEKTDEIKTQEQIQKEIDQEIQITKEDDTYLLYIKDYLLQLKQKYYEKYENLKQKEPEKNPFDKMDIRDIYHYSRQTLLKGKNICLSKIAIKGEKILKDTYHYQIAKKLGANIQQDVDENTDYVLTWSIPKQLKKGYCIVKDQYRLPDEVPPKIQKAVDLKKPILHAQWLNYTHDFHKLLDIKKFNLQNIELKNNKQSKLAYFENVLQEMHPDFKNTSTYKRKLAKKQQKEEEDQKQQNQQSLNFNIDDQKQ